MPRRKTSSPVAKRARATKALEADKRKGKAPGRVEIEKRAVELLEANGVELTISNVMRATAALVAYEGAHSVYERYLRDGREPRQLAAVVSGFKKFEDGLDALGIKATPAESDPFATLGKKKAPEPEPTKRKRKKKAKASKKTAAKKKPATRKKKGKGDARLKELIGVQIE